MPGFFLQNKKGLESKVAHRQSVSEHGALKVRCRLLAWPSSPHASFTEESSPAPPPHPAPHTNTYHFGTWWPQNFTVASAWNSQPQLSRGQALHLHLGLNSNVSSSQRLSTAALLVLDTPLPLVSAKLLSQDPVFFLQVSYYYLQASFCRTVFTCF